MANPKAKELPSQEYLRSLFSYDGHTGELRWRKQRARIKPGTVAGSITIPGYILISHNGHAYMAHRIVWVMHNGRIGDGLHIDHINGIRGDNRIENLRAVTQIENAKNVASPVRNTSGCPGVYWHKIPKTWAVRFTYEKQIIYLGSFRDRDEAISVCKRARAEYGFHENHGTERPFYPKIPRKNRSVQR